MKRIGTIAMIIGCLVLVAGPADALARHAGRHHAGDERVSGTVQSFQGNVLVIGLLGGGMASGRVTPATRIECDGMSHSAGAGRSARVADHDAGDGGRPSSIDGPASGNRDDNEGVEQDNDAVEPGDDDVAADQNDPDADMPGACGRAALTPGTVVNRARLRSSRHATPVFDLIRLAA